MNHDQHNDKNSDSSTSHIGVARVFLIQRSLRLFIGTIQSQEYLCLSVLVAVAFNSFYAHYQLKWFKRRYRFLAIEFTLWEIAVPKSNKQLQYYLIWPPNALGRDQTVKQPTGSSLFCPVSRATALFFNCHGISILNTVVRSPYLFPFE